MDVPSRAVLKINAFCAVTEPYTKPEPATVLPGAKGDVSEFLTRNAYVPTAPTEAPAVALRT